MLLDDAITPLSISAGTYLIIEGKVSDALFFIEEGYCRAFHVADGVEVNTDFYFENDFVANIKSLNTGTPSSYNVKASEDMRLMKIDRSRLLQAYKSSHEIETLGRKILETILQRQEEHAALFKIMDATERYRYLLHNRAEMLQRVSLSQLSSYLGVSRETLSRIRGRMQR